MGRTRSRRTHRRRRARRRIALSVLASALLLLLLLAPLVSRLSLFGNSDDHTGESSSGQASDNPDAGSIVSRDAGASRGAFARLAVSADAAHDRMEANGVPAARGATLLEQEAFDTWIALQPFRAESGRGNDSSSTRGGSSASGNSFPSLIAFSFATLPAGGGGGATFGAPGSALTSSFDTVESGDGADSAVDAIPNETVDAGDHDNPPSQWAVGSAQWAVGGGQRAVVGAGIDRDNGHANGASVNATPNGSRADDHTVAFLWGDEAGDPNEAGVTLAVVGESTIPLDRPDGDLEMTMPTPQTPAPVAEPTGLVLLGTGLVAAARTLRLGTTRR